MPIKKAGHTKSVMLNEKPADMIHAVSVVPMLAPMMTEMAWTSVSSPAFTKLTVITVVAVDDCTAAVMNVPVRIPVKRLVVKDVAQLWTCHFLQALAHCLHTEHQQCQCANELKKNPNRHIIF